MLLTILIGIGASVVTELITWINKLLSGTVLKGDGAFMLAALVAFVGATVKIYLIPTVGFQEFLASFASIWAVSQVIFLGFIQLFDLDVQSPPVAML